MKELIPQLDLSRTNKCFLQKVLVSDRSEQRGSPDRNLNEQIPLASEKIIEPHDYVVERIIGHFGSKLNRCFIVSWYQY